MFINISTVQLSKFLTKSAVGGSWIRSWFSNFLSQQPTLRTAFHIAVTSSRPAYLTLGKAKAPKVRVWKKGRCIGQESADQGDGRPDGASNPRSESPELGCFYVQGREKGRQEAGPVAELGHCHVSAPSGFLLSGTAGRRRVLRCLQTCEKAMAVRVSPTDSGEFLSSISISTIGTVCLKATRNAAGRSQRPPCALTL